MLQKIKNLLDFFAIPLCFLIFIFLNECFKRMYCYYIYESSSTFTTAWAFLLCGILLLLPVVIRRIGIVVLISFFALMNLVHAIMSNLFGSYFTFSDLLYTGEGIAFFSFTYLNARKLLWITSFAAIIASIVIAASIKKRKYSVLQAAIGLLIILIGVDGISTEHNRIMSGLDTKVEWVEDLSQAEIDANIYQTMSNKYHTMYMTGIYQYLYRSFLVTTGLENSVNHAQMHQELDKYLAEKAENVHESNAMTGIFEGKNVMYIMLESIDTWMLTEDFMPNLYALQQDSINFVNHYSPLYISAGTFNTEFIANTSIIPPAAGVDTKVYQTNDFPTSIANSFNAAGYTSNSFHGSDPYVYNRGLIHMNFGYNKYHNWQDMNMTTLTQDSQLIKGFDKMTASEPFFSFIITYSGHGPYTDYFKEISDPHMERAKQMAAKHPVQASPEDYQEYVYSIAHVMETDAFIGELVDALNESGLMEDTVLIFFTDHYGKYLTNNDLIMQLKNQYTKDMLCNTPFFIYHSGTEAQTVETLSSTLDILPTIANMFNLDVNYTYYTGVDVFSEKDDHYIIFPGNNWYDGEIYYTPTYSGELTKEIMERNREIATRVKYSEYMLKSNYFEYLSKKNK